MSQKFWNAGYCKDIGFNLLNIIPSFPFFVCKTRYMNLRQAWSVYWQVRDNMRSIPLKKRTNTLAVMGSGPSINELSSRDLAFLKRVDVLAFNYWAYHDLTPNFYMFEGPSSNSWQQEFVELIKKREQQYRGVVFLFKYVPWFLRRGSMAEDIAQFPASIQRQIRLFRIKRVRYRSAADFDPGLYEACDPTGVHPQTRGSVAAILSLALSMGYEVVILYGIDLSSGYFWKDQVAPDDSFHNTAQPRRGELSMSELIPLMREHLYQPHNRELFVGSTTSRLFPRVPLWQYQHQPRIASAEFI